jgi:hypothetical protein
MTSTVHFHSSLDHRLEPAFSRLYESSGKQGNIFEAMVQLGRPSKSFFKLNVVAIRDGQAEIQNARMSNRAF